ADLFRADLCPKPAIIAGYPWFEIWGRHTLVAMPGLYFATGRVQQAKSVLSTLLSMIQSGRIPNRLPDDGLPAEYHAADASLLLFEIAKPLTELLPADDDFPRVVLLPALRDVFESHLSGSPDDVYVTADGLLAAGHPGTSLTWMDARIGDRPVTSRWGLPIELQALWSKGCGNLAWLANRFGNTELAVRAENARDKARQSFRRTFWCDETDYPYDVVSAGGESENRWVDASIRPNALLALAIDPDLFTPGQACKIIEKVERELLTKMGIRSLSPGDPAYLGKYSGGIVDRDRAYHQGASWPSLLSSLSKASRAVYPDDAERRARMRETLVAVLSKQTALGQLPEVADGDYPNRPDGCIAFATSVAGILRALVEDMGE
ncbi:MAG: 4-alpha-glucanotransferase, partial [Polyangiaceae bacterium]|nr:4-alpha-glucanotransferase [Polyangiaceae bacterium]